MSAGHGPEPAPVDDRGVDDADEGAGDGGSLKHETPPVSISPEEASAGLPRLGMVALIVAAIALSLGLLRDLGATIAPMFLALNLLIAAFPIYPVLRKARVPRIIAAVLTMLTVFVILIAGILALVWCVTQVVAALSDYSDQLSQLYDSSIAWLSRFGLDEQAITDALTSISPSNIVEVAGSVLAGTGATTGMIAVVVVGTVFMTFDIPSITQRLGVIRQAHPGLTDSIASVTGGIRRYWIVTTIFGIIVSLINGGIVLGLGVSLPLVWVMLTFISNYIPNIGFVIGLVPPALLALVEKGPATAIALVVAFSLVNFFLQSLIQPKFTGDAVGITPTISFVSLLVWAWVFGALGALIALPATLTVKALLIDPDPRTRWLNALISNEAKTGEV